MPDSLVDLNQFKDDLSYTSSQQTDFMYDLCVYTLSVSSTQ